MAALLVAAAVFCLLMAVVPRPTRLRPASRLGLIRASTMDTPAAVRPRAARGHGALRRLTDRLGLGARWVSRQDLVEAGIDPEVLTPAEATTLKLVGLVAGLVSCIAVAAIVPGVALLSPAAAWIGFVSPSLYIARRKAGRRAMVLSELPNVVGLLRAFINARVPLEQALHLVSQQLSEADPENILAAELRAALGGYGLGDTIEASLQAMADRVGVDELRTLAASIAQGKRLGAGMEAILRDQELLVRLAQRNRVAAAASQISTRLMAVLVGVYLPEFVVLVMLPLFWGVMAKAFG